VTIKLFNGIKHPHLTQLLNEIKTTILTKLQFDEKPWRQISFPPTFPTLIFPGKLLGAIEFPQLKSKTAVQSEQGPFVIFLFQKTVTKEASKDIY
jgi:hypothetical protein